MKNYLIIIEKTETNYSAYSPDVIGCIATGVTVEDARKNFLDALEFHIEGLIQEGIEIPKPSTKFAFCSDDCSGVLNVRIKKSLHYQLIKLAQQEGVSISHLVNDALVEKYSNLNDEKIEVSDSLNTLTEREREILSLLVNGKTIQEIAQELLINKNTAKQYTNNILQKLCTNTETTKDIKNINSKIK